MTFLWYITYISYMTNVTYWIYSNPVTINFTLSTNQDVLMPKSNQAGLNLITLQLQVMPKSDRSEPDKNWPGNPSLYLYYSGRGGEMAPPWEGGAFASNISQWPLLNFPCSPKSIRPMDHQHKWDLYIHKIFPELTKIILKISDDITKSWVQLGPVAGPTGETLLYIFHHPK